MTSSNGPFGPGGYDPYGAAGGGQPQPGFPQSDPYGLPAQSGATPQPYYGSYTPYTGPTPEGATQPLYGMSPSSEPPKRGGRTGMWVALSLVAVLLIVGGVFVYLNLGSDDDSGTTVAAPTSTTSTTTAEKTRTRPTTSQTTTTKNSDGRKPQVGDCANLVGDMTSATLTIHPCDSVEAKLKVAVVFDTTSATCPNEDYSEYYETRLVGPEFKVCLIPNLIEGACYTVDGAGDKDTDLRKVSCEDESARLRVSRVAEGEVDEGICGEGAHGAAYPEPPVTYCLELL
ncbi:MAG TPA: hypothetical protein VIL00_16675 [Pseudonocardiaceae bacterium]